MCNKHRNRYVETSKAPHESQAQGTGLFTSAVSNQKDSQRTVNGRLRSNFQRVREGRVHVAVKTGVMKGLNGKTEDCMSQSMSS